MVGDNVVLSSPGFGIPWIAVKGNRALRPSGRVSELEMAAEKNAPVARKEKTDALFDDRGKLGSFPKRTQNEPVVQ